MRKFLKVITIGVLMASPIVLLTMYTVYTANKEAEKVNSDVSNLKLITPVAIIDEITRKLEEGDIEEALLKITTELPDANIPSSQGTPLVVFAAEKDYIDIVATLIQKGADPDKADLNTSETALIKAIRNKDFDMVKQVLLPYGANPNLSTNQGLTPLGLAIDLKDRAMADILIASGAINGISAQKLILYAFQKNNVGVSIMLAGGISANSVDRDNNTPLIIAAANGDLESAKDLIAYRANINAKNKFGMTPLLYAVKGKHKEMTEYLINNGAKINTNNIYGQNALFWAAYNGDSKLVHNLLMLGANYEKKTRLGQTALQMAKALGHTETAKMIEDFIAYKKLPRDSKGNIILPQVNKNAATDVSKPIAQSIVEENGLSDIGAGIMSNIDKTQGTQTEQQTNTVDSAQITEAQNNQQISQQSNNAQDKKQSDKTNTGNKQQPKTQVNKLQTSNNQPEMPQMPGGMDMSAIMSMMGGAQGGGGDMGEMIKQMQSMGASQQNASKTQQMQNMPQGMNMPGGMSMPDMSKMMPAGMKMPEGVNMPDMSSMAAGGGMPDISKMLPAGMKLPDGMDANTIMNMNPDQLKQMGVPEDQISEITQAKQQMEQAKQMAQTQGAQAAQNNAGGFKPKDLSSFSKDSNGRIKTEINKLQTSGN